MKTPKQIAEHQIELTKAEQIIVLFCKGHYDKCMPKDMTNMEALKLIWMGMCGHPEPYESSLEYIAKKLHYLATTLNDKRSDYVIDKVHKALMGNTMLVHSENLKPIEKVIDVYVSCVAFSSVRDDKGNMIINLPKIAPNKKELKRIFHGDFDFNDYKIFYDEN